MPHEYGRFGPRIARVPTSCGARHLNDPIDACCRRLSRRHVRIPYILLAALLIAAPWVSASAQQKTPTPADLGLSSQTQFDLSDAPTAIWLNRLNDIDLLLRESDIDPEIRSRIIRDLNAISQGAKARVKEAVSYTHLTLPTNREV